MTRIAYRDPKESKASIDAFAFKVLKRLHGLGAKSQTMEDVQQELWFAWCKACEAYRPECGASFKTFLYTGMQRHINRFVEKNFERFHGETVALSLNTSPGAETDGDQTTLADHIPDNTPGADKELEREQNYKYAMTRLSPRAQQFVSFLKEPPAEIINEFRVLEEKAEYARQRGISFKMPHRLTTFIVFDLMGASRAERNQILAEVQQIGTLMSEQAA